MNRGAEGTELLRTSLAAREARGGRHSATYCKAVLAERLAQLGSLDEALHLLNAATEQAERPGWEERCYLAGILRIKGELLAKNGDVEGAEINYITSLDQARRQQAKSWELRTSISLARLWQSQGRRQEAYELLAPVYDWFTEGFDAPVLKEAKALLDELA